MPALSKDQVRHIAKLARLRLTDAEVKKFSTELTQILQYVDMLSEVDTKGVEPLAQVTGQANVFRDDALWLSPASPDSLLATSPLPIADHQIISPSAHG